MWLSETVQDLKPDFSAEAVFKASNIYDLKVWHLFKRIKCADCFLSAFIEGHLTSVLLPCVFHNKQIMYSPPQEEDQVFPLFLLFGINSE